MPSKPARHALPVALTVIYLMSPSCWPGWRCARAPTPLRTSRASSCATSSQCCNAALHNRECPGPTEHSPPPSPDYHSGFSCRTPIHELDSGNREGIHLAELLAAALHGKRPRPGTAPEQTYVTRPATSGPATRTAVLAGIGAALAGAARPHRPQHPPVSASRFEMPPGPDRRCGRDKFGYVRCPPSTRRESGDDKHGNRKGHRHRRQGYNLIWFTEACLSNALRLDTYIQDAERDGDNDLAEFFRRAQGESRKCAEQAKQMLARRLSG